MTADDAAGGERTDSPASQPEQETRLGRLVHALRARWTGTYRRRALSLLLLALTVDYAERTLIGALGPTLERVFHFGNAQLGLLAAASGLVGALATIPMGMLADRVNRTVLLAVGLLMWAGAVSLVGAAVSFAMLFGARLLLGAVAAVTGPTTPSLTGDLVPVDQRGRALGFISSGQLVGNGLGFVLPVIVTAFLSFRWNFWLLGLAGLGLSVAFWRLREPPRTGAAGPVDEGTGTGKKTAGTKGKETKREGARDRQQEMEQGQGTHMQRLVWEADIAPSGRAILKDDPSTMSLWAAVRYVLRVRTDVIVLVARSIGDFFLSSITTFAVIFATGQYGLNQSGADLSILILGVGALAGVLLVGRIGDILLRRGRLNSRLWLGALGYILAPIPLYFAFSTHTLLIALPLFALGAFFLAGAGPPLDAVRIDVLVPALRGRAESIRQVLRTVAESGAPALIGVLSGLLAGGGTAGLQAAFIITLPALLLSGLILLLALRTYRPDVAAALASSEAPR